MLDLRFVRENIDILKEKLALRGDDLDLNPFIQVEQERRELIQKTEALRSQRNQVSDEISSIKQEGGAAEDLVAQMRQVSQQIKELEMPYAGLPTVKRIPSTGDLLFIWISEKSVDKQNPKIHRRCALTAAISRDEGETFINLRHIRRDPQDDFGYQCVAFVGQNLALVGYHARDGIHVARVGIGWFYGE